MEITADGIRMDLGGREIDVALRRSTRARRIGLRIDAVSGPVLVLPSRARIEEAGRFLAAHRQWLAERLAHLPPRIPLTPGARIPVLGQLREIRHLPEARRGMWLEDGFLCISGAAEHVPRRTLDFLKAEAGRQIRPLAVALAERLGRAPGRVSLRDTRSRWGSCSTHGHLSFSWRLVMAPETVLTYVVAHEVAHLVEMNHRAGFWRLVATLADDVEPARHWLKTNGTGLHLYG